MVEQHFAATVVYMNITTDTFGALALGDILEMPDGRRMSVRAYERQLAVTVGGIGGFVLAGEIGPECTLLGLPGDPGVAVSLYAPMENVPSWARDASERVEGVVSYWASHLPGLAGAMGELGYKVFSVRGQIEPMIILWRGKEMVVFVKGGSASANAFSVARLERSADVNVEVTRYSAQLVGVEQTADSPYQKLVGARRAQY